MKKAIGVVAALAILAGAAWFVMSRESHPVADEPVAVEETATGDSPATEASEPESTANESLEVVEESAAEPDAAAGEKPILLAQAEEAEAPGDWKYKEGKNYVRLVPTQPTVGGADKIEVAEFFWYGCPHCYNLEPTINEWAANKPANVRFVRVPATWNGLLVLHARLFYTEEILVRNGAIADGPAFHEAVFQEYHQRNNRMTSEAAIRRVFERFGVSQEEFEKTWNSFEVAQKLRVAQDLMRRYGITGVPTIVVNGKYRADGASAGGYPQLIELIKELVQRESLR